jgi:phage terminase small subunit
VALTAKQSLFIKEYLVDLNATQAAIRAGYSEKTAQVIGSENLSKPIIAEAIALGSKERAKKVNISAEYVLQTIKNTIERCAQAEPVFDRDGVATGEYQFDSGAVLKGSELLGKYLKLFTEKIDHSSSDGTMRPAAPTYNIVTK